MTRFLQLLAALKPQGWLLAAVLTNYLAERWTLPLMHVLFPLLMLLYLRSQPAGRGYLLALLAWSAVWSVAMADFAPFMDQGTWTVTVLVSSVFALLPYLADRLTRQRLSTSLGSLVFPTALVSCDYLRHLSDPTGSYGMLGYGIGADHPLAQLAAVTGVDGVSFLLAWGASLTATVFLQREQWQALRATALAYAVVIALAYGLGTLLMSTTIMSASTWSTTTTATQQVRIASIGRNHFSDAHGARSRELPRWQQNLDQWLKLSTQQAENGAQIIVWGEGALALPSDKEDLAIAAGQQFAKQHGVHLVQAIFHTDRNFGDRRHNKLIWIDNEGLIRTVYHKNHGQFAENTIEGDGKLGLVDTPWGRFGLSICWDADFPSFMRQAADNQVVALLNPSYDYDAVAKGRAGISRYRAIENGVALIRPNNNGVNLIADASGHLLASQRVQGDEPVVLTVDLPLQTRFTVYHYLRDAVSLLSVAAFFALLLMAWKRPRQQQVQQSLVEPVLGGIDR